MILLSCFVFKRLSKRFINFKKYLLASGLQLRDDPLRLILTKEADCSVWYERVATTRTAGRNIPWTLSWITHRHIYPLTLLWDADDLAKLRSNMALPTLGMSGRMRSTTCVPRSTLSMCDTRTFSLYSTCKINFHIIHAYSFWFIDPNIFRHVIRIDVWFKFHVLTIQLRIFQIM